MRDEEEEKSIWRRRLLRATQLLPSLPLLSSTAMPSLSFGPVLEKEEGGKELRTFL